MVPSIWLKKDKILKSMPSRQYSCHKWAKNKKMPHSIKSDYSLPLTFLTSLGIMELTLMPTSKVYVSLWSLLMEVISKIKLLSSKTLRSKDLSKSMSGKWLTKFSVGWKFFTKTKSSTEILRVQIFSSPMVSLS